MAREYINVTDFLNTGREKLNKSIDKAYDADEKSDDAISTSNDAKGIAETAENKADSVQTQFDQVVIDGDSSVEAAQARVDAAGNTFPTLKRRLDDENQQVTAQLAKKVGGGVKLEPEDFSTTALGLVTGEGGPVNILSEPQNYSVSPHKTTFVRTGNNLYNPKKSVPGTLSSGGNLNPSETSRVTEYIPIIKGDSIFIYYDTSQSVFDNRIVLYDKSFERLDVISEYISGTPITTENVAYFRTSVSNHVIENNFGINKNELKPHEPYYITMEDILINANSIQGLSDYADRRLNNKTMVNFGDSITEGSDYPTVISQITGTTTINVGFGGTRMAYHHQTGYDAFSMYQLSESIKNNDFTLQDNNVEINGRYAPILDRLKSINFSEVDYITINHGTNDYGGDVPVGDADSPKDGTTYIGALKKVVEDIQVTYPHIQILLITPAFRARFGSGSAMPDTNSDVHPNHNGNFLIEYVDAMIDVSRQYHYPGYNLYNNSGVNVLNYSLYFSDGLHLTDYGSKHWGNKLSSFILSNV